MNRKKKIITLICSLTLTIFTAYVLLDTFVITRTYASVESVSENIYETTNITGVAINNQSDTNNEESDTPGESETDTTESLTTEEASEATESLANEESSDNTEPVVTDSSYTDENISVEINEYTAFGSAVYVAEVEVSSPEYLKTALAENVFGKNVTATTSDMAESNNAILAVNGDYYGSRNSGYVLRNGISYRDTAAADQEDLVIYSDGSFGIINESETSLEELEALGAWQVLSFGPALVEDGSISVTEDEEVGRAKASNPRTAIGIIDDCHYVFVVSDGRTDESEGLSLYELAQVMQELGCLNAYNLDGGGSSTMYFNGQIINNPTSGRSGTNEREVSDIVYIG